MYPKDTEKWKQFTTSEVIVGFYKKLFCIPKILKNESNSQLLMKILENGWSCFVSQRYWKMKAIHNYENQQYAEARVVLYPKDTEKWKQFTTPHCNLHSQSSLFCIPKILKNESNSQLNFQSQCRLVCCFVSQRYWKMKAIHNAKPQIDFTWEVVLYPKDTEKWKQFTTS